jgi:UDP-glucose 4-epimerase
MAGRMDERQPSAEPGLVLVSGASGTVGREVCSVLHAAGWRIRGLGRGTDPAPFAEEHVTADLSLALPPEALSRVDAVVHLAAAVPGSPAAVMEAVNHHGAGRLADAAAARGIERFVALSSIRAVTGSTAPEPVRDDDEPAPADDYGRSKRAGELAIRAALPSATILRPPLVLGEGLTGAMARLVALARSPWPLPFGGLRAPRSYIARSDLAAALAFALREPAARGRSLLLSGDGTLSVAAIVALIRRAHGRPRRCFEVPPRLLEAAASLALGAQAAASLTGPLVIEDRAVRALGWAPRVPLSDAVIATAGLGRLS